MMKNNYAWMFVVILLIIVTLELVIINKLDSQCHVTYMHSDVLDSDMLDEDKS